LLRQKSIIAGIFKPIIDFMHLLDSTIPMIVAFTTALAL
jgi:hypothetical protein